MTFSFPSLPLDPLTIAGTPGAPAAPAPAGTTPAAEVGFAELLGAAAPAETAGVAPRRDGVQAFSAGNARSDVETTTSNGAGVMSGQTNFVPGLLNGAPMARVGLPLGLPGGAGAAAVTGLGAGAGSLLAASGTDGANVADAGPQYHESGRPGSGVAGEAAVQGEAASKAGGPPAVQGNPRNGRGRLGPAARGAASVAGAPSAEPRTIEGRPDHASERAAAALLTGEAGVVAAISIPTPSVLVNHRTAESFSIGSAPDGAEMGPAGGSVLTGPAMAGAGREIETKAARASTGENRVKVGQRKPVPVSAAQMPGVPAEAGRTARNTAEGQAEAGDAARSAELPEEASATGPSPVAASEPLSSLAHRPPSDVPPAPGGSGSAVERSTPRARSEAIPPVASRLTAAADRTPAVPLRSGELTPPTDSATQVAALPAYSPARDAGLVQPATAWNPPPATQPALTATPTFAAGDREATFETAGGTGNPLIGIRDVQSAKAGQAPFRSLPNSPANQVADSTLPPSLQPGLLVQSAGGITDARSFLSGREGAEPARVPGASLLTVAPQRDAPATSMPVPTSASDAAASPLTTAVGTGVAGSRDGRIPGQPENFASAGLSTRTRASAVQSGAIKQTLKSEHEAVSEKGPALGITSAKSQTAMSSALFPETLPLTEVAPAEAGMVSRSAAAERTHPAATAERAVEAVMEVAERASAQKRSSVTLQFDLHGTPLDVRVVMRGGEVQTTFNTHSPELRAALQAEWAVVTEALPAEKAQHFTAPVFTASDSGTPSSGGGDTGARQRQFEAHADRPAFAMARTTPETPVETPTVRPPAYAANAHHLHTLA